MACPTREGKWWHDLQQLEEERDEHGSWDAVAKAHGSTPSNYSKWHRRLRDAEKPGPKLSEAETIILDVDHIEDIDELLAERGLHREDWIIVSAVVNKWDGFAKAGRVGDESILRVPLRQLKVTLRPKPSAVLATPAVVPLRPPRAVARRERTARLIFLYGDDQRPNADLGFEEAKLAWIKAHQPDLIIDLGDGMDMPTISAHKTDPAMSWGVQTCLDAHATWLYRVRHAAPNSEIVMLADNHSTARLRDYQLARAAAIYGVSPAAVQGLAVDLEPLLSLRRMLRLDEIGVTYIAPPGDTHYAESQYELVPGQLVAIHGYRTGSALGRKMIDDYGCSVIYGHAHGQDVHVTDHNRRGIGSRQRLYALGVGCGARVHGGGGFAPGADWQNCALTISVFPDGQWTWDYMNWENGTLLWRDERIQP